MDIRTKSNFKFSLYGKLGFITLLLLFYVCLFPINGFSQGDQNVSKVESKFQTHNDYKKSYELLERSKELQESDFELSIKYAKESYSISKAKDFENLTVQSLYVIAYITYYYIERDAAISYYEEGYEIANILEEYEWQYKYAMELGSWHLYRARDEIKSRELYNLAIQLSNRNKDFINTARSYAKLAYSYDKEQNVDKILGLAEQCEKYFLEADEARAAAHYNCEIGSRLWKYDMEKAVSLYLRAQELHSDNYIVNNSIGEVYSDLGLPEQALFYLEEAQEKYENQIEKNSKSIWRIPVMQAKIANSYFQLQNYSAADSTAQEIISFFDKKERRKKNAYSTSYIIKRNVKEIQNKRDEALALYEKALEIASKYKISEERIKANLTIGEFYLESDNELAQDHCYDAYNDATRRANPNLILRACDCLYKTNKATGNFTLP